MTSGRLEGKVALVPALRAVSGERRRFAAEGAAVIAVDICGPVDTVVVPPSTPSDLDETVRQVRDIGGRITADIVDVRDGAALVDATRRGVRCFGGLDVVCATAITAVALPVDAGSTQRQQ